jgi:hypothetical protein
VTIPQRGGLPHSDIHGSTPARGSPWLFAACHVLHRLLVPRHPPNALLIRDTPDPDRRIQVHHAQKPSPDAGFPPADEAPAVSSLRTSQDCLAPGLTPSACTPRDPPIRAIRHTHTPLNPRRRSLGLPSRRGGITRSDIRSHDGPVPVAGFQSPGAGQTSDPR